MAEKVRRKTHAASKAGLKKTDSEGLLGPENLQTSRGQPCRCRKGTGGDRRNGSLAAAVSSEIGRSDGTGDFGHLADSGCVNDAEVEEILREFIGTLISLLEPRYAEVVWRAEILDQPPARIAVDLGLSKPTVTARLQVGRRDLFRLVMLALQLPLGEG